MPLSLVAIIIHHKNTKAMNKKIIVLVSCLFCLSPELFSQTEKNMFMAGNSLNFHFQYSYSSDLSFRLNPKIGYFPLDNFCLGLELNLIPNDGYFNYDRYYAVGPYGRYYFNFSNFKLFIENGISYNFAQYDDGISIIIGPGLTYFLNDFIAIENTFSYHLNKRFGESPQHDLYFNLGIYFYFNMSKKINN